MPYIDRDSQGRIVGKYNVAQREGQEFLDADQIDTFDTFDTDLPLLQVEFVERRDVILNVLTGMAGRAQRASKTDLALAMDALATLLIPLDSNALVVAAVATRDKAAVRAAFKDAARACAQQTLSLLPPADQITVLTEVAKVFK